MMLRALLLVTMLLVASLARADADEAAEIFKRGEAAAARGDYLVAGRLFEEAFQASPHPVAIYSAGIVWEKAGELARAADAYAKAITLAGMTSEARADARARLAALELRIGALEVDVPAGARVTVAHHKQERNMGRIHLPPGKHRVLIAAPDGTTQDKVVDVRAGATSLLRITPKKKPPQKPVPVTRSDDELSPSFIVGWVALGAATAATGVAIGLGVATLNKRDEYLELHGKADVAAQQDARDEAASFRTWTNVGWAAAGSLALAGIVCVALGWPRDERAGAFRLTPTGASFKF